MKIHELKGVPIINWKKIGKIGLCILGTLFALRIIVIAVMFFKIFGFINDFDKSFNKAQVAFAEKLKSDQEAFDERAREFDRLFSQPLFNKK